MKKKKIFLILLMFVVVVGLVSADSNEISQPHWIEAMDFDGSSPPAGFPDCSGSSWQDWAPKDYDCGVSPGSDSLDATTYKTSPRSWRLRKEAGDYESTGLHFAISPAVTKLHVRYYVYFTTDWNACNQDTNCGDEYIHHLFLNSARAGVNFGADIFSCTDEKPYNVICRDAVNSDTVFGFHSYAAGPSRNDEWQKGPDTSAGCVYIEDDLMGSWHAVEWMFDLDNELRTFWLDGDEKYTISMTEGNHFSINWIFLTLYLDNSDCRNSDVSVYIDNIVLATEYIGPLNGEPPICPNGICESGENCPADVSSCSDNQCYEPTCNNGCGQTLVGVRQTDESCSGNNFCDGSGNCVECIDNNDCSGSDTCVNDVCTPLSSIECSDGADNDGDGQTDYPNDPGCLSSTDNSEHGSAECDDGVDNDGDGDTDYRVSGGDQGCLSLTDNDETNCGDGQCEGGEVCDVCVLDCGVCGSSITVEFGDHQGNDYPGTVEDTFLNQGSQGYLINNDDIQLNTYTWPANVIANTILMRYDLSVIPSSATIQDANLQLYQFEWGTTPDIAYRLTAHKVINYNPVFSDANGYYYSGSSSWTAVNYDGTYYSNDLGYLCCNENTPIAMNDIEGVVDTIYSDKTEGYKTWDITSMVQDWVSNPSENYGLLIVSEDNTFENEHRSFYSSEYSDAAMRPKLVVTYSSGSSCSPADTDTNGVVDIIELIAYIGRWKNNDGVDMIELIEAIGIWKRGGC